MKPVLNQRSIWCVALSSWQNSSYKLQVLTKMTNQEEKTSTRLFKCSDVYEVKPQQESLLLLCAPGCSAQRLLRFESCNTCICVLWTDFPILDSYAGHSIFLYVTSWFDFKCGSVHAPAVAPLRLAPRLAAFFASFFPRVPRLYTVTTFTRLWNFALLLDGCI